MDRFGRIFAPLLLAGCLPPADTAFPGAPPPPPDSGPVPDTGFDSGDTGLAVPEDPDCAIATWVPTDHPSIQDAIDAASSGDTICVEAGTWYETLDFSGKDLLLIGAYGAAVTTIDADGPGPVVSFVSGEGPDAELRGFAITGGVCSEYGCNSSYGGGLYIVGASPTLRSVVVEGNEVYGYYGAAGAGVYVSNWADPTLIDVVIRDNIAGAHYENSTQGAGLYLGSSSAWLERVTITGNQGGSYPSYGDGLYLSYGDVVMANVAIVDNGRPSVWRGAGLGIYMYSATLYGHNVIVAGHQADSGGSLYGLGVFAQMSHLGLQNATIHGNIGGGDGSLGAGLDLMDSTATLVNTAITGNIISDTSDPTTRGEGLNLRGGGVELRHCLLFDNGSTDVWGLDDPVGTEGNISVEPDYVDVSAADPLDWDLSLAPGSQLEDAGSADTQDADGGPADIGAYGGRGGTSW